MSAITPRNDHYFELLSKLSESAVTGSKVLAMLTAVNEADKFEEHFAKRKIYGHSNFTPEMLALGQILFCASDKVRDGVVMLSA